MLMHSSGEELLELPPSSPSEPSSFPEELFRLLCNFYHFILWVFLPSINAQRGAQVYQRHWRFTKPFLALLSSLPSLQQPCALAKLLPFWS